MGKWTRGSGVVVVAVCALLAACGSDEGVSGGQVLDAGGGGGGDVTLGDSAGGDDTSILPDGLVGDTVTGDSWVMDGTVDGIWDHDGVIWPDAEPFGCVSDSQCPSTPCTKGICDLASHQCVNYSAPDYTYCDTGLGACGGDGFCVGGKCQSKGGVICDDGNPCTQDSCDPAAGGCVFLPIPGCGQQCFSDTQCNDGNFCTNDYCKGGQCLYIAIPNCYVTGCKIDQECDDGLACSIDKCQIGASGVGSCVHYGDLSQKGLCCDPLMNAITCNDGNPCTQDYCGMDYKCQYPAIPGCGTSGCKSDADCDDGIKCSIDTCLLDATGLGKCQHYGDLSQTALCCDPFMDIMSCNDGNPCTADSCGMNYQCQNIVIPGCTVGCTSDKACYDGNACTTDMCIAGTCQYGGIACASPDPCQTAACDPKTGQCIYTPIPGCGQFGCKKDYECDDGNFCTVDICAVSSSGAGKCMHKADLNQPPGLCCDPVSSATPPCNDGDACTQDICGPDYMCQFMGIPGCINKCKSDADCPGGDVCTIAKCDVPSGVCLYGSIPNCCNPAWCDDGNPCTQDGCDAATGGCAWKDIPGCIKPCDPAMCNDYNPCTQDGCDPKGNCYSVPIPNCQVQYCKTDMECQDADICTKDYCDYSTYTCAHITVPGCGVTFCKSNAECNDFNNCTGDLCLNNQCAHKNMTCDDGNPCTADMCNQFDGSCSNAYIPGCVATPCKQTADCNDKNVCTTDTCISNWCNYTYTPGCIPTP